MTRNHTRGILAVGIICLFVGVSIHPAFAVNSNKSLNEEKLNDDELTEVIIEVYGIKDFSNNTFYLTKEETEKLDLIISDFKINIDTTVARDESEYILNNTFDNLTELGLINGKEIKESIKISKKIFENIGYSTGKNSIFQNNMKIMFFVLIALRADYANFMPSYIAFLYRIYSNYDYYEKNHPILINIFNAILNSLANIAEILLGIFGADYWGVFTIMLLSVLWFYFNPFPIGYAVSLSYSNLNNYGWVRAIGLLGIQIIDGEFRGALGGFTGLRIFYKSDFYMFGFAFGSALEAV